MFLEDLSQVAVFIGVTLVIFGNYFVGSFPTMMHRDLYIAWFKEYSTLMWLPPLWIFPVVWTVIYVLVEVSMIVFYQNVYTGEDQYVVISITLLFLFNMLANKLWSPTFIEQRMTGAALFLIAAMLGTGIAMLIIFGLNDKWTELGTFLPYMVWCFFAFWLNGRALWVERKLKRKEKKAAQENVAVDTLL